MAHLSAPYDWKMIGIRMPLPFHDIIRKESKKHGSSVNSFMNRILYEWLEAKNFLPEDNDTWKDNSRGD